jgi:hypothetical protein
MNEVVRDEVGLAGSVKCISCGNRYQPVNSHGAAVVVGSHPLPADAHQLHYHINPTHDGAVFSSDHGHVNIHSTNVGLRSLLPQEVPQVPRDGNPYGNGSSRPNTQTYLSKATIAKEPLYRQAKLASAMKEMVKVPLSASTGALHASYAGK